MTEAVYDRYKEALRRGHVNALRGRLEQAAVAYDEAATIAPERALPHTSLGSVFMKLGRTEDAVAAFSTALDRAPRDETALQGRADALAELGRRAEAAEAYGVLAEALDGTGRAAEALDAARRAIELAESKELRRHLESLAVRLREGQPDDAAQAALDRASAVLTGRSPEDGAGPPDEAIADDAEGVPGAPPGPPDLDALTADAEAALDAGDDGLARERLIELARGRAAAGQPDAALDACSMALAIGPDDPDVHLAFVALYLERGWRSVAIEKVALLGRLSELTGDESTRDRLRTLVADHFPGEPRLAGLSA